MKVLIATDGSACSLHAIAEAARLLPLERAEIHLVAVVQPIPVGTDPMLGYAGSVGLADPLMLETGRTQARAHLEHAKAALAPGGARVETHEAIGEPVSEILALADRLKPDLIVLGTHGRGPVGRLVLGSVSEGVLHRWTGPIMIVPPRLAPGS